MTDYSNIEGVSEEEQIRLRKQMEELLGEQFSEEDSFREQARTVLEENNIRNATSVAAQASDIMLMDYMRLFYLQQEFDGIPVGNLPDVVAYEMAELEGKVDLTEAPAAEAEQVYTGPTVNIAEGPAAVTASSMADAYVERFGGALAEGPLDHSDTVVTQADLRDAIEKYESIEITQEEIEAYQQEQLDAMVDIRLDGLDRNDPANAEAVANAEEWAREMGMPRESTVIASLRHERFIENHPEMALSEEQAAAFAADGGPTAELAMRSGDMLGYYTDTRTARDMGMGNYLSDSVDLRNELEAANQEAYEQGIADNVSELGSITEGVSGLAFNAGDDPNSNIDNEALQAKQAEMNAAFEAGDYNGAINAANAITTTVIGDIEARQIEAIDTRFDDLQEAAAEAGYTVETPEQMYELLNDEAAGGEFIQAMSNENTFARGFFRGEDGHPYSQLEQAKHEALAAQDQIELAAAKYENIELEEADPAAMTTQGVIAAEAAAQPATDFDSMAKGIIDEFRDTNGTRIGGLLDATGQEMDFERLQLTNDILGEDFNAGTKLDIDNPEDLASAMIAAEVYRTGEMPDAETIDSIRESVNTAFDQDTGVLMQGDTIQATIAAEFQAAAASTPSGGFMGLFRDVAEVGIPEGYDARLAPDQIDGPPQQEHPQQGGMGFGT